jgi:hypothetical protein
VRAGQCEQRRAEADQHVGAQTRRLCGQLSFDADCRAQHGRDHDLHHRNPGHPA